MDITLAAVTVVIHNDQIDSCGDSDYRFAIESVSKVCSLALEDVASDVLHDKVGADPSRLPFNSVIALELYNGKPLCYRHLLMLVQCQQ